MDAIPYINNAHTLGGNNPAPQRYSGMKRDPMPPGGYPPPRKVGKFPESTWNDAKWPLLDSNEVTLFPSVSIHMIFLFLSCQATITKGKAMKTFRVRIILVAMSI
jgi:hypothetical protein